MGDLSHQSYLRGSYGLVCDIFDGLAARRVSVFLVIVSRVRYSWRGALMFE